MTKLERKDNLTNEQIEDMILQAECDMDTKADTLSDEIENLIDIQADVTLITNNLNFVSIISNEFADKKKAKDQAHDAKNTFSIISSAIGAAKCSDESNIKEIKAEIKHARHEAARFLCKGNILTIKLLLNAIESKSKSAPMARLILADLKAKGYYE